MEHQIIFGSFFMPMFVIVVAVTVAGLISHIGGDKSLSHVPAAFSGIGGGWAGYVVADWYWYSLTTNNASLVGGTWLAWGTGAIVGGAMFWAIAHYIASPGYIVADAAANNNQAAQVDPKVAAGQDAFGPAAGQQ